MTKAKPDEPAYEGGSEDENPNKGLQPGDIVAGMIAGLEPPTGLAAAMIYLRAGFDPDASVLWEAKPPRQSHITDIAQVLVEIEDAPRKVIVVGFTSGSFKVYAEIGGKTAEGIVSHLGAHYQQA